MHNTLILFGATGDLAQRYLFPSLLRLFVDGLLPEDFRIRALALSQHDTDAFREVLRPRLAQALPIATAAQIDALLQRIDYRSADLRNAESVAEAVRELQQAGFASQGCMVAGQPVEVIVAKAKELNCELIIMGHRHLSRLGRMLDPSISAKVIDRVKVPVLVGAAG